MDCLDDHESGRTTVRFEVHQFWDRWGANNEGVFRKHFKYRSDERWTGHQFRAADNGAWEDFHGSQAKEHEVLEFARTLDDTAALESASYGAGQIMGFNFAELLDGSGNPKYASVQEMYEAMGDPEANIMGLFEFIETNKNCLPSLQNKDYVAFAHDYNGSGQADYYGGLIGEAAAAYERVLEVAGAENTEG